MAWARADKPSPPGMSQFARIGEMKMSTTCRIEPHAENHPVTFVRPDCSGGPGTVSHPCLTFCCGNETRSPSNRAFPLIVRSLLRFKRSFFFRHRRRNTDASATFVSRFHFTWSDVCPFTSLLMLKTRVIFRWTHSRCPCFVRV